MKILKSERKILQVIRYAPAVFIVLTSIFAAYFVSLNYEIESELEKETITKEYIKNNKDDLKSNVNFLSEYINNQIELSETNIKTTKAIILEYLKNKKYKNGGYVFVFDTSGKILLSKDGLLNGKNVFDKKLVHNMGIDDLYNEKYKEKFVNYKLLYNNKEYHKIAYLKKIEPLNWIIGTSFDLDNLYFLVEEREKRLNEQYQRKISTISFFALVIILILSFSSYYLAKYIENRFLNYNEKILEKEFLKFESIMGELKDIFDNLPMMIIYKDTKNNIIRVNKNTAESLAMSQESLANVPSKDIFPNDHEKYYEDDLEIIKNKKPKIGFIERYESKEGYKVIETSKVPVFDKEGEVQNIIVFMIDITEKEAFREENVKKERLLYQQNKLASMGEMINNIAHQWRQPLSTISTASTGAKIQKEMDCLSDKSLFSALDAITNSAQYLSQTIDDFRNFFNPSKNRYSNFKISLAIDRTLKLITSKFEAQSIKIIKEIEDIELNSLENDLLQVMINILNNALDELVKIKGERLILINAYKANNSLIVDIKDNAGGIKLDNIEQVFEAYFTTKEKDEGTGIGLYMSKEILNKLLNGDISVSNEKYIYEDKEYEGANFKIEIEL